MKRKKKVSKATLQPDPLQAVSELVDLYRPRASVSTGDTMLTNPGQVLENIADVMERVDADIDTWVAVEDFLSPEEAWVLVNNLGMGPMLAVHVVNTAMEIMAARYPTELVRAPLPAEHDLRKLQPGPVPISDQGHEIAKTIFNRRIASAVDLTEDDIAAELEPLDPGGQIEVFIILFMTFGAKVGAIKNVTGIE
jgi:hypothetical protein